jgi:hypothetical protein
VFKSSGFLWIRSRSSPRQHYFAKRPILDQMAQCFARLGEGIDALDDRLNGPVSQTILTYSCAKREDRPMATAPLNIVVRIGGSALTTCCANFCGLSTP